MRLMTSSWYPCTHTHSHIHGKGSQRGQARGWGVNNDAQAAHHHSKQGRGGRRVAKWINLPRHPRPHTKQGVQELVALGDLVNDVAVVRPGLVILAPPNNHTIMPQQHNTTEASSSRAANALNAFLAYLHPTATHELELAVLNKLAHRLLDDSWLVAPPAHEKRHLSPHKAAVGMCRQCLNCRGQDAAHVALEIELSEAQGSRNCQARQPSHAAGRARRRRCRHHMSCGCDSPLRCPASQDRSDCAE